MSNIEDIEKIISAIDKAMIDYPYAAGYMPYRLINISKLLLDELKDLNDRIAQLEQLLAENIRTDYDNIKIGGTD